MLEQGSEIEYLEEVLGDIFVADAESLLRDIERNADALEKEFLYMVDNLCKRCYEEQNLGRKGDIQILHFCYYQSARLTQNYKLQAALYDQNFYLDRYEISSSWNIEFIMKYFEQEMELFENKAKQNIIGFHYSHMQKIRQNYFKLYFQVVGDVLQMFIPLIGKSTYFEKMNKTASFCINYSEYMMPGFNMEIKE